MTVMDYAHRFESLAKPNKANGTSRHLIDANCDYVDGAFRLSCLPPKLPILFTVRFTAPADFTPGDVFTLKGQEFAVKTRLMEDPSGRLFCAGAVVQCDIDMERELAFFTAGSVETAESCGCRYQTGHLSFYIDPDGDDSLNNPGTVDSPFKTLAGARNAVSQRYIFTSMGGLYYNINPGRYELNADDYNALCQAAHPFRITFRASDQNNKPLLVRAGGFGSNVGGLRAYEYLRLEFASNIGINVATNNATVYLLGVELIARASTVFLHPTLNGAIHILRSPLILDAGGNAISSVFNCHGGAIFSDGIAVTIKNMPSVDFFAYTVQGYLWLTNLSFTGTTSGKRYHVNGGAIHTGGRGANYFPGTVAGTVANGGVYS